MLLLIIPCRYSSMPGSEYEYICPKSVPAMGRQPWFPTDG